MKIGSWNISGLRKAKTLKQYDYEKTADLEYYKNLLNKFDLDILFLQENLSSTNFSYSAKFCEMLNMNFYYDTAGTKSYIDPEFFETLSVITKEEAKSFTEIEHINPNWTVTMDNGYNAKSYDRKYQIINTKYGNLVHTHFLPEKFFKKDYTSSIDQTYIKDNLNLLDSIDPISFFCGDLNTRSIKEVFTPFFQTKKLVNAFEDIGTRPLLSGEIVPQDVICYSNNIKLLNKGIEKTETDHFFLWAEFEDLV